MENAHPQLLPPRRPVWIKASLVTVLVLSLLGAVFYFTPGPSGPPEILPPPVQVSFVEPIPTEEIPTPPVEEPAVTEKAGNVSDVEAPVMELPPAPLPPAPAGSDRSFLGISDDYRRVVIAFDVADSVRRKAFNAGIPLERVRDEAAALVAGLDVHSAFTLIQFVRRYDAFSSSLLPATEANRVAALAWLHSRFRTDGRSGSSWESGEPDGIELLLGAALDLSPEVLFIISDGDFQRTASHSRQAGEDVSWREIEEQVAEWQRQNKRLVRVHVVGLQMDEDHRNGARRFVARFGGQLRLID